MPQSLTLPNGKSWAIDRKWVNGGEEAMYAMVGTSKVMISPSKPASPTICQVGDQFYYEETDPVTNPDHVSWLPEPFKSKALKFIEAGKFKPAKLTKVAGPEKAKKKAKKPPVKRITVIDDDASYKAAGGTDPRD